MLFFRRDLGSYCDSVIIFRFFKIIRVVLFLKKSKSRNVNLKKILRSNLNGCILNNDILKFLIGNFVSVKIFNLWGV